MSLKKKDKAILIEEIVDKFSTAKSVIIAEYRGLDVISINELRKNARESGVYLKILKNSLVQRAIISSKFEGLSNHLVGPLIYSISDDAVLAAKILVDFEKKHEKLVVKIGALPNSILDVNNVKSLAVLPSREELLSNLLLTMQAPTVHFARILNEIPSRFVRVLASIRDQIRS